MTMEAQTISSVVHHPSRAMMLPSLDVSRRTGHPAVKVLSQLGGAA